MYSSLTPASSYRASATYSTYPSTPPRHTSTPTSHPVVVDTYPSTQPRPTFTSTSLSAAVDISAPASSSFHNHDADMLSASRTIPTNGVGYKSIIDKARAIQKEDTQSLYEAAKVRHAHKLRRAKQGRERADEAAIRIASSSNLNTNDHYQQLLVGIKENVKATFEAEWIAEVREDVYRRYPQIASEYEADIKDETYTFLVDSLEPVVKADLRLQLEPQIREELREELRAEVRSELRAQHQAEKTVSHQAHAAGEHVHSKAVQTMEAPIEAVVDTSSSTLRTRIDTMDVSVGANDIIADLDGELGEEVSSSAREDRDEVYGQEGSRHFGRPGNDVANESDNTRGEALNVAQFQVLESPLMESVETKEEHGSAIAYDDRYEDQSASRSGSVGSKRSWSSEDDYEGNESPSKRQKNSPEDLDEIVPWPFDDEQYTDDFQQQGPASPPSSDDYFESEEEHQDVITPGPFVQLAPQFGEPATLIAQTNTADDAWLIPDSDDEGEVDGRGDLVGTGFVSVNKAGINVMANEVVLHEGDDR